MSETPIYGYAWHCAMCRGKAWLSGIHGEARSEFDQYTGLFLDGGWVIEGLTGKRRIASRFDRRPRVKGEP
jgi:hypothetical protein